MVIRRLKIWAGLYRSRDVGTLFRLRSHLGLQLTSVEFPTPTTCKVLSLRNSNDETIKAIWIRKDRVSEFTARWSAPNELKKLEPVVEHNLRYAGQSGRAGLGSLKENPYIANPSLRQRRASTTEVLKAKYEEQHVRHASCLLRQGVWTHWDNVVPFDLSWENLIYGLGRVLSPFYSMLK